MKTITLANLAESTGQEVFDYVAFNLLTQNKKSESERLNALGKSEMICMYRSSTGLKCAAGHLIADDEYRPEFEGRLWNYLVQDWGVTRKHFLLITELQSIHDTVSVCEWLYQLTRIAAREEFDTTILEQFK